MADPATELAKEFLEFYGYTVRTLTKFYKNKELKGTAGDIDIIAVSPNGAEFEDFELKEEIVAEVKNWLVKKKSTVDRIYKNKFRYIDDYKISWKQLKEHITSKRFDRVLFCFATTEGVYEYALKKYGIKIITFGFMIKKLIDFYKEHGRATYYPEAFNFTLIRSIMNYMYLSHRYKDKLLIEDIVWIDPEKEPQYRNKFVELNSKFLEEFIYHQTSGEVFSKLIQRFAEKYPSWFKKQLKSNERFWAYLTGKR